MSLPYQSTKDAAAIKPSVAAATSDGAPGGDSGWMLTDSGVGC